MGQDDVRLMAVRTGDVTIILLPTCKVWAGDGRIVAIDESLTDVCVPIDSVLVMMIAGNTFTELTPRAKVELADVMIDRWTRYKKRAIIEAGR